MVEHDKFSADLMELEALLVRQFRAMQELLETSQKERAFLLNNDERLMRVVEDKEVLLDQLGLIEDARRKLIQDLSMALKIKSDSGSIGSLLPHLRPEEANRIGRLAEGVVTLAGQTRELNEENHALALVKLDWVKAAQSVFIGMLQPPDLEYRPASAAPTARAASWGAASVEVRA